VATYSQGITTGVRGLAGALTPNNDVTLIATTNEFNQNHVVVFVDDGSVNPVGTVIATAPLDTVFRGVALSPQ
jgi:hypothetical protein